MTVHRLTWHKGVNRGVTRKNGERGGVSMPREHRY